MLIDFPSIKSELSKIFMQVFNQAAQAELGPFQGIKRTMQHEGSDGTYSTVDGTVRKKDYQRMEVNYRIEYKDVPDMTLENVFSLFQQKGKEMGEQMGRYMFKTVDEITKESGNIVDSHGKPFSLDLMFETIEKMQIPFDEQGNPVMPTLVIHPNMSPRLKEIMEKEEVVKEYEERHKKLIEQKRKEWNEEQNSRKLVD